MDKKYFPKRVFINNRILFAEQIVNWLQYHTLLLPLLLPLAHIGMVSLRYLFHFYLFILFFNISMVSWQYLNSAVYWEVKRWTTLVGGSEVFPRTGPRYNSCKSSSSQPHHPGPALALLILLKLLKRFSKFNASKSSVHCLLHPPLQTPHGPKILDWLRFGTNAINWQEKWSTFMKDLESA